MLPEVVSLLLTAYDVVQKTPFKFTKHSTSNSTEARAT